MGEICGFHGNVKMTDTIDIPKLPQKMDEQLLKVSSSQSKLSFQEFENTLDGWEGRGVLESNQASPYKDVKIR